MYVTIGMRVEQWKRGRLDSEVADYNKRTVQEKLIKIVHKSSM